MGISSLKVCSVQRSLVRPARASPQPRRGVAAAREACPRPRSPAPRVSSVPRAAPDHRRQLFRCFLYCPFVVAAARCLLPLFRPRPDAPEPCRRTLRVAPQRTRWRSWSTTSTRSTSTRTPPRCASSQPRRASRRRRRRNGLSSAWLSGGRQKACPRNADLSRTRQLGTCRVLRELHLSLLASA